MKRFSIDASISSDTRYSHRVRTLYLHGWHRLAWLLWKLGL